MKETEQSPEMYPFAPLTFLPEIDALGRSVPADGAQIRLNPAEGFTSFLVLKDQTKISLCLVRPDESDLVFPGESWFVYGDRDTGDIHIQSTTGHFGMPKNTLIIGSGIPASILSFRPEKSSDLILPEGKILQPIALIWKNRQGQPVISRRYTEQIDITNNMVNFVPVSFELVYPNISPEAKAARTVAAQWRSEQKEIRFRQDTLREIRKYAETAGLRLSHRNKILLPELTPETGYDDESKKYSVHLYVSSRGRDLITGRTTPVSGNDIRQIGEDFGFGEKLIFAPYGLLSDDPDRKVTGSFRVDMYMEGVIRSQVTLVENVEITPTERVLSQNLYHNQAGGQIYRVSVSSTGADNIINVLRDIERSLKPRYLPEGEI